MARKPEAPSTDAYRGPVRRLRVVVSDGEWRVLKEMRIERMSIRASWEPPEGRGLGTGSFVEVLDGSNKVLHRQPVHDPTDTSVEIFERGAISRVDNSRDVVMDILAPEPSRAARLRLVVRGADLPLREGRAKPHTRGFALTAPK